MKKITLTSILSLFVCFNINSQSGNSCDDPIEINAGVYNITEIDGNEVTLNFSDPAAPVLIVDDAEDNLFFVLMPMRI